MRFVARVCCVGRSFWDPITLVRLEKGHYANKERIEEAEDRPRRKYGLSTLLTQNQGKTVPEKTRRSIKRDPMEAIGIRRQFDSNECQEA